MKGKKRTVLESGVTGNGTTTEGGRVSSEGCDIWLRRARIIVRGREGSPLVVKQMGEKPISEIREGQAGAPRTKKKREPEEEFMASRYIDLDGRECIKVECFKKAVVNAALRFKDLTKVAVRQALFFRPSVDPLSELVVIENYDGTPAKGEMREDAVTIAHNTRTLAYRPTYVQWQLRVDCEYDPALVSTDQLKALIKAAGWGTGLCEGRPQKTSALDWGRFRMESFEDLGSFMMD